MAQIKLLRVGIFKLFLGSLKKVQDHSIQDEKKNVSSSCSSRHAPFLAQRSPSKDLGVRGATFGARTVGGGAGRLLRGGGRGRGGRACARAVGGGLGLLLAKQGVPVPGGGMEAFEGAMSRV